MKPRKKSLKIDCLHSFKTDYRDIVAILLPSFQLLGRLLRARSWRSPSGQSAALREWTSLPCGLRLHTWSWPEADASGYETHKRDDEGYGRISEVCSFFYGENGTICSKEFKDFVGYCDSAYRILRRHANVILNLFSLMLDAGIPNIAEEKDKAVFKVRLLQ